MAATARLQDVLWIPPRPSKPRRVGLTMVNTANAGIIGLCPGFIEPAFDVVGDFIDICKMSNISSILYPERVIRGQIEACKKYKVKTLAGGILSEVAFLQGKVKPFLDVVGKIGFDMIEISENMINPTNKQRMDFVNRAMDKGLQVVFEWGRKFPDKVFNLEQAIEDFHTLIEAGVKYVIFEGGEVEQVIKANNPAPLQALVKQIGMEHMIVERAHPTISESAGWIIKALGPDVNLGNVPVTPGGPDTIAAVEQWRHGFGLGVQYAFLQQGGKAKSKWWKGG